MHFSQIITKDEYGNPLLRGGENLLIRVQGERDEPENKLRFVTLDSGYVYLNQANFIISNYAYFPFQEMEFISQHIA